MSEIKSEKEKAWEILLNRPLSTIDIGPYGYFEFGYNFRQQEIEKLKAENLELQRNITEYDRWLSRAKEVLSIK